MNALIAMLVAASWRDVICCVRWRNVMVIWVSVWKTACPLVAMLIAVPPVSSARVVGGKLGAKGPVSSSSGALV